MEQFQAFEPGEDLAPYEAILDRLSHVPLDPDARRRLAEVYREGYVEALLGQGRFPATALLQGSRERIADVAGVLDSALLLQTLGILSEGIAVGRGHDRVTIEDATAAQEHLCDRWPECAEMRTEEAAFGLAALMVKLGFFPEDGPG
ncbi:MAG: hypothetical protein QOJ12_2430 [Thermoleophilales bacterium]|nr:hypothetical protein [Thermoleophilales bacterium]